MLLILEKFKKMTFLTFNYFNKILDQQNAVSQNAYYHLAQCYLRINKKVESKNLAATIVLVVLILLVVIPLWFLTPVLIDQSIQIFISSQGIDFVTPLKNFFPSVFSSEIFSNQIGEMGSFD